MARRSLCRFGSLVLALASLTGCAPGNPGLVILNVVSPNGQCLFDVGNPALASGILDATVPPGRLRGYTVGLRVGNQLINLASNGSRGVPSADPNILTLESVEVELQDTAGNLIDVGGLPNPFTQPASGGAIPSSDGSAVSEGIAFAEVIPLIYVDALAGANGSTIIVQIRAVGRTVGDAEVVSPVFGFPVTVCIDCLFGCPREADMEAAAICRATCFPGQDGFQSVCPEFGPSDCAVDGS